MVQRPNVACLSSRSVRLPPPRLTLHLSFTRSLFPHPLIHSLHPSCSLGSSFSLVLPLVFPHPWLYLSCVHPLRSPTNCQNHPSNETQTVLPNVCATHSLAICISFVSRHRIFRERVLLGDFRSSCRVPEAKRRPCLRSNLRHRSSLHPCREPSIWR